MAFASALIFDLNGTLSDDERVLLPIDAELFARRGRPLREDEYHATLGGDTRRNHLAQMETTPPLSAARRTSRSPRRATARPLRRACSR